MIAVNPDQRPRLLANARKMMLSAQDPKFRAYWERVYLYLLKKFQKLN
jgi:hypothetical protein